MRITPATIKFHELIGLEARIFKSSDLTIKNVSGKVVDETRNTLKLYVKDKIKIVPKVQTTFVFKLPDSSKVKVHGSLLVGRPEDRLGRFK